MLLPTIFVGLIACVDQILVFENNPNDYYCLVTLQPDVAAQGYFIYKNSDKGENNAKPVHEGDIERMDNSTPKAGKYKLEIVTGANKVKKDGTAYSFQITVADSKAPIFTEPFAWDSSKEGFVYYTELSVPFYRSLPFLITMGVLGLVVVGGAIYVIMKKGKQNVEEEL
ncbi:hypothetical protein ECANGB1_2363 [Enterospora canceri]|uniref:Uncharacterized protein n=1 Tax=Enterospora canceri TaxID=1081671 RepID=A0A1Y1S9S5_9MICR|nr:hypothetical protein ECANGB1_2363 [Enterospora canceri]